MRWLAIIAVLAGCYDPRLGQPFSPDAAAPDSSSPVDAPPPPDGNVDVLPWGPPTRIAFTGLPAGALDDPTLTDDMLEMYFNLVGEIWVTRRSSTSASWAMPVLATELNSTANETTPEISGDGLAIFLGSDRPGGLGGTDVWIATRTSRTAPWSAPVNLTPLNTAFSDLSAVPRSDGLVLLFTTNRDTMGGASDICQSTRPTTLAPWGAPIAMPELSGTTDDLGAFGTADRLSVYFESARSGQNDLYVARRDSASEPYRTPEPIVELNTAAVDGDPWVAPDRRHLFFASTRSGAHELYESSR